jgi:hypothetical protein
MLRVIHLAFVRAHCSCLSLFAGTAMKLGSELVWSPMLICIDMVASRAFHFSG